MTILFHIMFYCVPPRTRTFLILRSSSQTSRNIALQAPPKPKIIGAGNHLRAILNSLRALAHVQAPIGNERAQVSLRCRM
jgi:hypothetical protein